MAEVESACKDVGGTEAPGGFAFVEETVLRQVVREIALTLEKNEEKFQQIVDKIEWLALSISGLLQQGLPKALRERPTEIITFPQMVTAAGERVAEQSDEIPFTHIVKQIVIVQYSGEASATGIRIVSGDYFDPEAGAELSGEDIFSNFSSTPQVWPARGLTIDCNVPVMRAGRRLIVILESEISGAKYGVNVVIERMG